MEKFIYVEEKQLNNKVVFLRRVLISLAAAVGSLFSSISCFGIEPSFEKISFTNIGSQLANLLNEITSWMLLNRGFVFKELEGSDGGYTSILILIAALLTLINYLIICSKQKKLLVLTMLPLAVAVLITEGEASYLWVMVFAAALGAMFAEMGSGCGANIRQILIVTGVVALTAAILSGDVTGKFFEKTEDIRSLDKKIEKVVTDKYYGENLLENGVVGKENRDDANEEETALKLQMTNPQSTYLRGFVGEMYSQGQWTTLPNGAYTEIKNLLYWLDKGRFSVLGQLSQLDSLLTKGDKTGEMSIEVEKANKKYAYVPYEYVGNKVQLFSKDGAYLTKGNIGRATSYTYEVRGNSVKHWTETAGKFYTDKNQNELKNYKINESYYNQMAYEYYTYLSVEEKRLLKEYVGNRGNQSEGHVEYSEAINRVLNYLNENTYYTERPAMENSEDTSLKTFFKKGKGYDVHYATAATLMFRYYGIPARYVEGYLVTPDDVKGKTAGDVIEIPRKNIHAWTEIYVDGLGFVPLEVSPKYKDVMEEADLTKGIENNAFKIDFENTSQKLESLKTLEKHQDKKTVSKVFAMIIIGVVCMILSLLLLVLLYKITRKLIIHRKMCVYFKRAEPKDAICAMFEYLEEKGIQIEEEFRNLGNKAAFSKMEISEKERAEMLKYMKKVMSLLIAVAVAFTATSCGGNQPVNINKEVETAAKWVMEATPAPCIGSIGGDWAVKGIASSGYDSSEMEDFMATYIEDVKAQIVMKKGQLDDDYYTSYARIAIGYKEAGENPLNVEGYNIVEKLDDYDKIMEQGVIGSSYALIGAKVANYQLKNEKKYVDFLVNEINEQLLYEKEVWIDVVAMAVEALSFYSDREDVAATIEHCINGLSKQQHKDGSYGNCESTAEVIIALTMAGIDPITDERFDKNGKNIIDGLLLFKGNERYLHTVEQKEDEANNMSTEKALLGLASVKLQAEGKKLY